ncbi:MAG: hypothetical protein H0T52_14545 [Lautropia sp.]|nr:hypothetical protein [Lautropia sp.]
MTAGRKTGETPPLAQRRLLLKRGAAGSGALTAAAMGFAALPPVKQAQVAEPRVAQSDAIAAAPPARPHDEPFWFGFIGDTPYSRQEEGSLRQILTAMSAEPLEFVLHVGDIKSRTESCGDDLLSARLDLLDHCPHPLVLTPGDNDWTDCTDTALNWPADRDLRRLERLQWLRLHAYRHPQSLGRRRMSLQQQSRDWPTALQGVTEDRPRLPENLRWRVGSLQFCTLHVVGSNNAPRRAPALEQAWLLRQEANGDWLNGTVELALREKAKGLVIALHANMRFEYGRSDGWERMRQLVIAAAVAFDGPVLLLHGDTHHFRSDLLLHSHGLANLRRVECFGSPFSASWVQIRWEPSLARTGAVAESDPFQVATRALP